jgi:hypothetical protein
LRVILINHLEYSGVGDFDSSLNASVIIIVHIYIYIYINEFKDYSNCMLGNMQTQARVFWLFPSIRESRCLKIFAIFGKRSLTKPQEWK